jgi:beta-glucanase (GH16 family)
VIAVTAACFTAVAIAASLHGGSPPIGGPLGVSGRWHLVFDDEFSGTSLDTRKWSTGWFGSGITGGVKSDEPDCYDPSQVAVSGGGLNLTMLARSAICNGGTHHYVSGLVSTHDTYNFTYGVVQARAWLPASGGAIADWPAIWADGLGDWPATGELDVVEGIGGQACWHFHDLQGDPGSCTSRHFAGGWHTFAADWEPGLVRYYYDGRKIATLWRGITDDPMYLILGLGAGPASAVSAPATMRIDYIRVWQH